MFHQPSGRNWLSGGTRRIRLSTDHFGAIKIKLYRLTKLLNGSVSTPGQL